MTNMECCIFCYIMNGIRYFFVVFLNNKYNVPYFMASFDIFYLSLFTYL